LSAARAVTTSSGATSVAADNATRQCRDSRLATPMRATVFNRGNNHNCDLYDSVDATMPRCLNAAVCPSVVPPMEPPRRLTISALRGELLKRFAIYATRKAFGCRLKPS